MGAGRSCSHSIVSAAEMFSLTWFSSTVVALVMRRPEGGKERDSGPGSTLMPPSSLRRFALFRNALARMEWEKRKKREGRKCTAKRGGRHRHHLVIFLLTGFLTVKALPRRRERGKENKKRRWWEATAKRATASLHFKPRRKRSSVYSLERTQPNRDERTQRGGKKKREEEAFITAFLPLPARERGTGWHRLVADPMPKQIEKGKGKEGKARICARQPSIGASRPPSVKGVALTSISSSCASQENQGGRRRGGKRSEPCRVGRPLGSFETAQRLFV